MVRGGIRKTDVDEIHELFQLTSPTWVSTPESESRRHMIFENEWLIGSLAAGTKAAYCSALRSFLKYVAGMTRGAPGSTGLQDSDEHLSQFLHWLLDDVERQNQNVEQKMRIAPLQQVEHAIQALSCVKKCQAGVPGQSEGWQSSNSIIKGPVNRAKKLQAAIQASAVCSSGLNNKILTEREYCAYISEAYTYRGTPEHAVTACVWLSKPQQPPTAGCGPRTLPSSDGR